MNWYPAWKRRDRAGEGRDQQDDEQAAARRFGGLVDRAGQPDAPFREGTGQLGEHQAEAPDVRQGADDERPTARGMLRTAAARLTSPLSCPMACEVHPEAPPQESRRGVPPAAAPLVPPPRPRPALATHPRSLVHPGVRIHAAADPGGAGRGVLAAVPRAVPDACGPWPRREPRRGARELGGAGLLPPGGKPAPAGQGGHR